MNGTLSRSQEPGFTVHGRRDRTPGLIIEGRRQLVCLWRKMILLFWEIEGKVASNPEGVAAKLQPNQVAA